MNNDTENKVVWTISRSPCGQQRSARIGEFYGMIETERDEVGRYVQAFAGTYTEWKWKSPVVAVPFERNTKAEEDAFNALQADCEKELIRFYWDAVIPF